MNWLEVVAAILGSGGVVALITLIQDRLKRKDTVEDKGDLTLQQIENLRSENNQKFNNVDNKITKLEQKVDIVAENNTNIAALSKAQAYDRIRHLSMLYIKQGFVCSDELKNLLEMFEAYKKLDSEDSFLDKLLEEVLKLKIKDE